MAHPGGRPPIISSPEEMQARVDAYFNSDIPVKTMCGLALALGYCDRQSIYDNMKKPEFSCILKQAMLQVEDGYETRANSTTPTGPIFVLKNMGWRDKSEVDNTHRYPDKITVNFTDSDDDERSGS